MRALKLLEPVCKMFLDPVQPAILVISHGILARCKREMSTTVHHTTWQYVLAVSQRFAWLAALYGWCYSHQSQGGGLTILSNRVNYVFNLKGPSMTVDTACSSTMYALHMACRSLQVGDCSAAVVAGTNLSLASSSKLPASAWEFSHLRPPVIRLMSWQMGTLEQKRSVLCISSRYLRLSQTRIPSAPWFELRLSTR